MGPEWLKIIDAIDALAVDMIHTEMLEALLNTVVMWLANEKQIYIALTKNEDSASLIRDR